MSKDMQADAIEILETAGFTDISGWDDPKNDPGLCIH